MSDFREGVRVIVELTGFIDGDGEVDLDIGGYVNPRDFEKYKVRLAPVEIKTGALYRDAEGQGYIGSYISGAVSNGIHSFGPGFAHPLPVGLVEVSA